MYGHLLSMHGVSRPGKEVVLIGFNIDVKRSAVFCVKGKPIDGHFMEEFEHILEDDDIVDLMENQEIIPDLHLTKISFFVFFDPFPAIWGHIIAL